MSNLKKIRHALDVNLNIEEKHVMEAKKIKLTPGSKISSRAFKKMKTQAKVEQEKRASKPKAPKTPAKVVVPKTKTPEIGVGDEKHPLEWILKNHGKAVRSKLVTQVHPADRGRVQSILVNDPEGVNKFMSGQVAFRRMT